MFPKAGVTAVADQVTADAMTIARSALIAHAVTGGIAAGTRPGEFPCPDKNNDGIAETACATGALGRIPWKTLGIPAPRDAEGEILWYAVGSTFRNAASQSPVTPINSETLGNLTVRIAGSATPIATQAVAVIISPGAVVGDQNRASAGSASCSATGTNEVPNRCASNYLESYDGVNNASASGPFISVGTKELSSFNDRLLFIRTADVIPPVEQRVGSELRDLLIKYRSGSICNCYPWAADWGVFTGQSITGRNRGRFPIITLPHNWGIAGTPALPAWVAANNWQHVTYYSAGQSQLDVSTNACTTCSASTALSVVEASGTDLVSALLLTPGTPRNTVARPSTQLVDYFEHAQNTDSLTGPNCPAAGVGAAACDTYADPASTTLDRDRLFTATTSVVTCHEAAESLAILARGTTCGGPGNTVIAACKTALTQLASCGCKAAGTTLTKPPCYNVSNRVNAPKQCLTALTQLDACV
jgi:hypothetical protein